MHPALIPILAIPHLLIPAALAYTLYLDQEETISRVKHAQNIKRFWYREYLNSPMAFFVKNNKRSIQLSALKHKAQQSRLAQLVKRTVKQSFVKCQQRRISTLRKHHSPLSRFVQDNHCNGSELKSVKTLTSSNTYNCHSPMRAFAVTNKYFIQEKAYTKNYNFTLMRPRKTLMTDFISSPEVQNEIKFSNQTRYVNKFREELWKGYFYTHVCPKILTQRGIVCSKLGKFFRNNIVDAEINYYNRTRSYNNMLISPLHNLSSTDDFKDALFDNLIMRQWSIFYFDNHPMHKLAMAEAENISLLASRRTIKSLLKESVMHNFITNTNNRIEFRDFIDFKRKSYETLKKSPLRIWTKYNKQIVNENAHRLFYIKAKRCKTLLDIEESLFREYPIIQKSMNLQTFKREYNIGNVAFSNDCCNYVTIEFPPNTQLVDQFLSESNLDGFVGKTTYYNKNEFISHANCLLDNHEPTNVDALINAAQTFKNISHLTNQDTKVSVLADSGKVEVPIDDENSCKRLIELHFVKRDHTDFTVSQYRSCMNKAKEFVKNHESISFEIGFMNRWLSDTLIITLSHTDFIKVKSNNLASDIIQSINLIKGIIFAKVIDRVQWLQLANKENE